ncbi:auxin-responsive protein IAA16-like [Nymphaea colorata]|nr:auxin-responsive protein IAA16-like [Nymphaea colorata]
METELTLGLPGGNRTAGDAGKAGTKRAYRETINLSTGAGSSSEPAIVAKEELNHAGKMLEAKAQLVGWPPVRSFRMNALKSCRYVKVALDGAPYLRKVGLETHGGYHQLLDALDNMFGCSKLRKYPDESKPVEQASDSEYVAAYEDRDGDWMLVGDVPWEMFVESCKRMRLMKNSDAIGLAPRTPDKRTN